MLGADVQINSNILISGYGSLVIIARKFGTNGGNIYIKPSVTNVGATLIADGALMNGNSGVSLNWLNTTDRDFLGSKLTINGRLSTYNTRGGSLIANSNALSPMGNTADGSTCAVNTSGIIACDLSRAASQDLERFRLTTSVPTSNEQCTFYVTGTTPRVIPILSDLTF